ncbi:MAG: aminopeptidase P family protein [Bacteroides sp.]|nr:aminopeptidase P family protein [Bacteroides sp.]
MQQTIKERISSLRNVMAREGISACIIPSTDPHMSEYVASCWKTREWLSGFTGSAGTLVVTSREAGLWTDSRYFLQAEEQLTGSGIDLYRDMLPETPDIPTFLGSCLQAEEQVGIDGKVFSTQQVETLRQQLSSFSLVLNTDFDPIPEIWADRPPLPTGVASAYELSYAGVSSQDKIAAIREEMRKRNTSSLFLSALDEIAWVLNIRGKDVKCNPVVISYLLITSSEVVWFIAPEKITPEVARYLATQDIQTAPYESVHTIIGSGIPSPLSLNPAKTNYAVFSSVPDDCKIIQEESPVPLMKAIRNATEIRGVRQAMVRDGIALCKFLYWLSEAVPAGKETELSVTARLHAFRSEQPLFQGDSFDTIAGYRQHAAIVHYSATPESDQVLLPKGFLLLDSGAQYLDGTTDITRTLALGPLTTEEITDYTLVLKGHIALATARFPKGTRGAQLDVLARLPLWQHHMNYLHGTGHGVGHYLNVHEGPQSIRMNENPVVLQPDMVTSNEPGVYKADSHGIRIENLILVRPDGGGMYGEYYAFETLTLCPICRKGIDLHMLTDEEISWINTYHAEVYRQIAPSLTPAEQTWLREQTCPLTR